MANFQDDAIPDSSFVVLSNRERLTENFIKTFLEDFERKHGSFNNLPADLSLQTQMSLAEEELGNHSMLLAHRYNPMVKEFIRAQFEKHLNSKYGHIVVEPEDDLVMAYKYRNCFNAFITDRDSVDFAALNHDLIKGIAMQDYFTLMFYSMATMKRQEGDNCLCLLVVSASSTGKTLLFESPIQQVSHNFTNEAGVGRFNCNGKSILLLHDVNVGVLTRGQDMEKLKAIARTEPVCAKVHSKTFTLSPIFILGTSNQLLFPHRFPFFEKARRNVQSFYKADVEPNKRILQSDIDAIKYRYIEMMVRQRPELPDDCLPKSGNFKREHLILGLYHDVLGLLSGYDKDQFGSDFVYLYAIFSLCRNFKMTLPDEQFYLRKKIMGVIEKYQLTRHQVSQCVAYLAQL